jgi:hypothetical protein
LRLRRKIPMVVHFAPHVSRFAPCAFDLDRPVRPFISSEADNFFRRWISHKTVASGFLDYPSAGLEPDRLAVSADGRLRLAFHMEGSCEVKVGPIQTWILAELLAQQTDRVLKCVL